MKYFVLGCNGMLGSYVYQYLKSHNHEVYGVGRASWFDAANFQESPLKGVFNTQDKPFTVINCVGSIKQKHSDAKSLFEVNGHFPILLGECLEPIDCARLIHISSDCVFSGNSRKPYLEYDLRDASDFYGQSKSLGEECAKLWNCRVIRTSIIGEDVNYKASLLEWVRTQHNKKIDGYLNHYWNGVTCLELAKAILYLSRNFIKTREPILHLHSPESVSKFELIKTIANIYRVDVVLKPTCAPEAIDRRLESQSLFYQPPPLEQQIREQKQFRSF